MGGEQDGARLAVGEVADQLQYHLLVTKVQRRAWLIQQDILAGADQRAGNQHQLLLAAGGGALAWAVYLACTCNGLDIFAGLFFATLAAALASELLARAVKAPVIMLLVPMLIPLIPGGDLYYMMSFLVRGQYEAFGQYAQRVLTEAGAIALGIICVASLMNIIAGLRVRARGGK